MIPDLLTVLKSRQEREPQHLVWTPELVDRFWDGIRATRLTEFNFSRQSGRALVLAVEHLIGSNAEILDFGAGDGDLVALLLERGHRAAAFETSAARQQALAARLGVSPGFLGVVDERDRRTFDVVLMVEVVEHLLDASLEGVLARVAALTAPGGTLVVTTPNNEDLELGMCYDPLTNLLFHKWQHVRSFTAASLADLFGRAGFDTVATHEIGLDDRLFVPYDPQWGGADPASPLPSHIDTLRANQPSRFGAENNLMYVGTKRP